jgi:serine protease Do
MKRLITTTAIIAIAVIAGRAPAQQIKNPELVKLFKSAVAKSKDSTVRVYSGDKEAALGTVVSADGWILTKFSELKGKITVKLADGKELEAELFGHDLPCDIAMIKVDTRGLTPVEFVDSKAAKVGHWVATPGIGEEPVALGVLSVAAREVKGAKYMPPSGAQGGYLGINFELNFAGIKISEVRDATPAKKAGLKVSDQIIELNGKTVDNIDDFLALLARNKTGDEVKLKIIRDEKEEDYKITLGQRPNDKNGKSRSDQQNNMGSKLSDRRAGFPVILQHDSVVRPSDCGGPLVNLDGQVIGINIARAGRVESYAIPSEVVRPLVEKLKMKTNAEKKPG